MAVFNKGTGVVNFYNEHYCELKSVDQPLFNTAINSTGQITPFGLTAEGPARWNRIGRRLQIVKVESRLYLKNSVSANQTGNADYLRIAIVFDRQTNGAAATYSDIYTTYDQNGVASSTSASLPNLDNSLRFVILKEWNIPTPQFTNSATIGIMQQMAAVDQKYFIENLAWDSGDLEYLGLEQQYKDTSAAITSISRGSLLAVMIGQTNTIAAWNITGRIRVYYKDC